MSTWELGEIEVSSNPDQYAGSYCYFIVPFTYKLDKLDKDRELKSELARVKFDDVKRYRTPPNDINLEEQTKLWRKIQRTEYFTGDVEESLFEHAKWYETTSGTLCNLDWKFKETVKLDLERIVLFEDEDNKNPISYKAINFSLKLGIALFRLEPIEGATVDLWLKAIDTGRYLRQHHKDFDPKDTLGDVLAKNSSFVLSDDSTINIKWPTSRSHNLEDPFERYYPDDRAFIYSLNIIDTPQGVYGRSLDTADERLLKLWHQILYVESAAKLHQPFDHPYERDWMRSRTYERQMYSNDYGDGILYGWSHYSACCLIHPSGFAPAYWHWQDMYLDLLLILLYQRTICFRASAFLARMSRESLSDTKQESTEKIHKTFHDFREKFTHFTNLYWFPILSNQVQGIEMFEKARESLWNVELFDEVEREIAQTDTMLSQHEDSKLNKNISILTPWTIIIGLIGLFAGFLGANLLDLGMLFDSNTRMNGVWGVFLLFLFILISCLCAKRWIWPRICNTDKCNPWDDCEK